MNKKIINNKHGQLILFVIIGIIIVVGIIFIFLMFKEKIMPEKNISLDINQKMEKCIRTSGNDAIKEIIPHGGYSEETISLKQNIIFEEIKIPVLCSTSNYNELCTNNEPMLLEHSEEEIKQIITNEIENCFSQIEAQYKKTYNYTSEATFIYVKIIPSQVNLIVKKKITIKKLNQTESFEDFSQTINSGLYDSLILTNEIINEELECDCERESCNADIIGLNANNHNFEITKPVFSNNNEEVYIIKEISSGNKFQFAVKNCFRRIPEI